MLLRADWNHEYSSNLPKLVQHFADSLTFLGEALEKQGCSIFQRLLEQRQGVSQHAAPQPHIAAILSASHQKHCWEFKVQAQIEPQHGPSDRQRGWPQCVAAPLSLPCNAQHSTGIVENPSLLSVLSGLKKKSPAGGDMSTVQVC